MEELNFIPAIAVAFLIFLISVLTAFLIQYKSGINPNDDIKRRIVFWILAFLNPVIYWLITYFYLAPDPEESRRTYNRFIADIPFNMLLGFLSYLFLGFLSSKIFQKSKIGHWFPKKIK